MDFELLSNIHIHVQRLSYQRNINKYSVGAYWLHCMVLTGL